MVRKTLIIYGPRLDSLGSRAGAPEGRRYDAGIWRAILFVMARYMVSRLAHMKNRYMAHETAYGRRNEIGDFRSLLGLLIGRRIGYAINNNYILGWNRREKIYGLFVGRLMDGRIRSLFDHFFLQRYKQ